MRYRAKYQGGQGTLKSSAWEVLKHQPNGLSASDLQKQIDGLGEFSVKDVSGVSILSYLINSACMTACCKQ